MQRIGQAMAQELKVDLPAAALQEFTQCAEGDARQLKLMIELYAVHPDGKMRGKDHNTNIWDVVAHVFKGSADPLLVPRFQASVGYGSGLVQANYPHAVGGRDFEAVVEMADHMATFDLLQNKEFEIKAGHSAAFLVQSVRTLPNCNQALELEKPAAQFFQPMSQKIRIKRYRNKYGDGSFNILDAHYVKDCLGN